MQNLFQILFVCVISFSCSAKDPTEAQVSSDSLLSISSPMPSPIPFDTVEISYLLGKFDPAKDPNFDRIPDAYSGGSARGTYLRKESLMAFAEMHAAAKADGISLTIISSTRNFGRQKAIWEAKWTGSRLVGGKNLAKSQPDLQKRAKTILLYSSMPGTSRHHWGTDMDLNALNNEYFESGKGKQEFAWLRAHAHEYGFCQPYTPKGPERLTGYEEERWHWSYQPLAATYMRSYEVQITPDLIQGFAGAEVATDLHVIQDYVFGVSEDCWEK